MRNMQRGIPSELMRLSHCFLPTLCTSTDVVPVAVLQMRRLPRTHLAILRMCRSAPDPEAKGKLTTILETTKRFAKTLMDYSISRSLSTEYGNPLPTAFLLEARSEVCEALSLHGIAFAGFDELVCSQDDVSTAWNFDHSDAELRECNWSVIQAIADLLRRFPVIHLQASNSSRLFSAMRVHLWGSNACPLVPSHCCDLWGVRL